MLLLRYFTGKFRVACVSARFWFLGFACHPDRGIGYATCDQPLIGESMNDLTDNNPTIILCDSARYRWFFIYIRLVLVSSWFRYKKHLLIE